MATPADQRLLELLDKWLASLELHAKYCALDDASYARVQGWPPHQRPSRWIVDLARQKALALRAQLEQRIQEGDATFADSLELMTFLANLVGAQHIERFIPLAEPADQVPATMPAAVTAPAALAAPGGPGVPAATATPLTPGSAAASAAPPRAVRPPANAASAANAAVAAVANSTAPPADASGETREMPRLVAAHAAAARPRTGGAGAGAGPPSAAAKAPRAAPTLTDPTLVAPTLTAPTRDHPARTAPAQAAATGSAPKPVARDGAATTPGKNAPSEAAREQVIADAARLVQWGRKWYELAELIASMADRPHLTDVRRILKDYKSVIDERASAGRN